MAGGDNDYVAQTGRQSPRRNFENGGDGRFFDTPPPPGVVVQERVEDRSLFNRIFGG